MYIKYEAEVSSRVGGGERGVVDFGGGLESVSQLEQCDIAPAALWTLAGYQ